MEISSLKTSLKAGISRDEFIEKYIDAECDSGKELESINTNSVSLIFDEIDSSKDGVIDQDEYDAVMNLNMQDGENGSNILSDADLKIVYNNVVAKIQQSVEGKTAEEVYNNFVESGMSGYDILRNLSFQIDVLKELIIYREESSKNIISSLESRIDDLVLKAKTKNKNIKEDYLEAVEQKKKYSKESETYKKRAAEDELQINNINENIRLINIEIEDLENSDDNKDKIEEKRAEIASYYQQLNQYQSSYDSNISLSSKANENCKSQNNIIKDFIQQLKDEDKSFKSKVETFENKIKDEETSCDIDIQNYNQQIRNLEGIQNYAIDRIQVDGVMSDYYDEDMSNVSYDSKEVAERWRAKISKGGAYANIANLSDGFFNKLTAVAQRLGCSPDALMGVMMSESGLNPAAYNKHGGASGLIQFMPTTAKALGTSTDAIRQMSAEQQLVYVEKYLQSSKRMAGFTDSDKIDAGALYSLVFLPGFAKRDVLTTRGEQYYNCNAGLDTNKDGKITRQELGQRVLRF